MKANDRQVGGDHYKIPGAVEHWDIVAQHGLDYFQGQITKYVMRWREKNGVQDLEKALHFLQKYIEVAEREEVLKQAKLHTSPSRLADDGPNYPLEALAEAPSLEQIEAAALATRRGGATAPQQSGVACSPIGGGRAPR